MASDKSTGKKLMTFLVIALLVAFGLGFMYISSKSVEGVTGQISSAVKEPGVMDGFMTFVMG